MQQHTGLRMLRQLGRLVSCAHAQFSTAQFPRSASQHLAALTQLHATVTQQQFNHRLLSSTCSLQRWRGVSALQHQQHCQHDRPQQAQRTQLKPAAVDLRHYPKLQKQQCRHYSVDDAARKRLLAAQQRRQREQELAERRAAVAAGQQQDQLASPPPAAAVDSETTAIAPQESVPSEVQVANVVDHEALIVTRNIEWGTVLLGFEQATKYTVYDQGGNIVALIAEEITGIGNEIQRQLLRTRRSFKSTVLSADGSQVVFRVRRPAYLINSYMYIEDPEGEVIGEVRQRWHPWRRMYDLYIGKKQFATVNSGFLAWEFEMKDRHGNTLALIDRNFLGFAKELFTDAGKYVVHFGYSPRTAADMCTKTLQIRSGKEDVAVTPIAQMRTDVAVIPTYTGNQLVVQEPLPLSERLIALAAAISVDYNYFSRLSGHSGMFSPPLFMPLPVPSGGVGGVGTGAGSAAEGAAGVGTAAPTAAAGAEAAAGAGSMNPTPGATDASPGFNGSDDAGFSSGLGAQGSGFSDDADSFKWDTGGGGAGGDSEGWGDMLGGAGGGDDDSSSGLWGILASIWAMIFGD